MQLMEFIIAVFSLVLIFFGVMMSKTKSSPQEFKEDEKMEMAIAADNGWLEIQV